MLRRIFFIAAIAIALQGCGEVAPDSHSAGHSHEGATEERGAHGGRLLQEGDFAVEVTIFERGVPPEFRLYVTQAGKPVPPSAVTAGIELTRIGAAGQRFRFSAREDYLVGDAEVSEPHSFDVAVTASHQGKSYRWTYDSYEGRTAIAAAMAKASGVVTAPAGPGVIQQTLPLYGTISADATRLRTVTARFPGPVRSVAVEVGETVKAGQTLATIESNESLQTYAVTAPIAGVVTQRRANAGEMSDGSTLFEIADHARVWAVLNVFPRDRARLRSGLPVAVQAADGAAVGTSVIDAIGTVPAQAHQPLLHARVVLDNSKGVWTPGQFVNAEVAVAETPVAVAVPVTALQRFRDWDVVFVNIGDTYQAQPVTLGARDSRHVEITGGLSAGTPIVVANAYLIKADIEKSGASHDH